MGKPSVDPVLPDYQAACLSNLSPALLGRFCKTVRPTWLAEDVLNASQVVLLVLDGLGWDQLQDRWHLAPSLRKFSSRAISSVAPTTTATALTSITTGLTPAQHGVVGYRVAVHDSQVMNVLRWQTAEGDAQIAVPPEVFQPVPCFGGRNISVVTKSEFAGTGFTKAHLSGARMRGWRVPSSLLVELRTALALGESFVYAYYEGIDKVAHEFGLGEHYDAELAFADYLVGEIADALPPGAALVVTSDHGQVDVGDAVIALDQDVLKDDVVLQSGEGRFRWLHCPSQDRVDSLATRLDDAYGHLAWVKTKKELDEQGWFGGPMAAEVLARLGDVALIAHQPVAFADVADTGELCLMSRHGSLTSAEALVPLCSMTLSASL